MDSDHRPSPGEGSDRDDRTPEPGAQSTMQLIQQAQGGDDGALSLLCDRYLPRLRRWASGRLPRSARDLLETDDLVQESLLRTIDRLPDIKFSHEGTFQAYIRQSIINRIRDEVRKAARRPTATECTDERQGPGPSPLEATIGEETVERYERALSRLSAGEREAIHVRVELGMSYAEAAEALGKPTEDAARMSVSRALLCLAREMAHGSG